jgi:hypothetical protein
MSAGGSRSRCASALTRRALAGPALAALLEREERLRERAVGGAIAAVEGHAALAVAQREDVARQGGVVAGGRVEGRPAGPLACTSPTSAISIPPASPALDVEAQERGEARLPAAEVRPPSPEIIVSSTT